MKHPHLFLDENYSISEDDFMERFHIIVFSAIYNLYHKGCEKINEITIDNYLSNTPQQYAVFVANQGLNYLSNISKLAEIENFDYHYERLKKFTLLRRYKTEGIDIKGIYNDDLVDPVKQSKMSERFDKMTLNEILDFYDNKIVKIKTEFYKDKNTECEPIGKGVKALIELFKHEPDIGLPLNGNLLNTIVRGSRRGKLYLRSSPSGMYKSRMLVADCCKICIPWFYDIIQKKWIYTSFNESALFIGTENELSEYRTMFLSYLSGVEEDKIRDGKYLEDEEERVLQAAEHMESSNIIIERIPSYSISDIERAIKCHHIKEKITYCYFDYIFMSVKMITELGNASRGMKIRSDHVLLVFVEKLKFICGSLSVHLSTSTQLSSDWKSAPVADNSLLRDAKSMSDKVDVGIIGLPVVEKDLEALEYLLMDNIYPVPNMCMNIYKVRTGKRFCNTGIKLWIYFNGGTCRTTELFATDTNYRLLQINGTNIEKIIDENETVADINSFLSNSIDIEGSE